MCVGWYLWHSWSSDWLTSVGEQSIQCIDILLDQTTHGIPQNKIPLNSVLRTSLHHGGWYLALCHGMLLISLVWMYACFAQRWLCRLHSTMMNVQALLAYTSRPNVPYCVVTYPQCWLQELVEHLSSLAPFKMKILYHYWSGTTIAFFTHTNNAGSNEGYRHSWLYTKRYARMTYTATNIWPRTKGVDSTHTVSPVLLLRWLEPFECI